jgi:hypothetical protein
MMDERWGPYIDTLAKMRGKNPPNMRAGAWGPMDGPYCPMATAHNILHPEWTDEDVTDIRTSLETAWGEEHPDDDGLEHRLSDSYAEVVAVTEHYDALVRDGWAGGKVLHSTHPWHTHLLNGNLAIDLFIQAYNTVRRNRANLQDEE